MRSAEVFQQKKLAGLLEELEDNSFRFTYLPDYEGEPVSFAMPIKQKIYNFKKFPPVFEGLLPEGIMLEAFLRQKKIDRDDYFSQLVEVGKDLVGSLTIKAVK
jgi:serine/threonine-protein kinase HipA